MEESTESSEDTDSSQTNPVNKKQRKAAKKASKRREQEGVNDTSESEGLSSGVSTPVGSGPIGKLQIQPTTMAGGRRRKGVPRKVPDRKAKEKEKDEPEHP